MVTMLAKAPMASSTIRAKAAKHQFLHFLDQNGPLHVKSSSESFRSRSMLDTIVSLGGKVGKN
jgi:hypothetical protein